MTADAMAMLVLPTKGDGRLLTMGMIPGGVWEVEEEKGGWDERREGLAGDGASVGGKWVTE